MFKPYCNRVIVSFAQHAFDSFPVRHECTWGEFVNGMRAAQGPVTCQKEQCQMFFPAEFINKKRKADLLAIHFGVADLDDITDDQLVALLDTREELGLQALLFSTWSHTRARNLDRWRLRLVVPFTRPLDPTEWSNYSRAWELLFPQMARESKVVTQGYFGPFVPEPTDDLVFQTFDGKPLDVDVLLSMQLPDIPQSSRIVSRDMIKALERNYKRKQGNPEAQETAEKLRALLSGEPLGHPGDRERSIWHVCHVLGRHFRDANPLHLAEFFYTSIQSMKLIEPFKKELGTEQIKERIERAQSYATDDASDQRPLIRVIGSRMHDSTTETSALLTGLYQHAGRLMRVQNGQIRDVKNKWFHSYLTSQFRFERKDERDGLMKLIPPPPLLCDAVFEHSNWPKTPQVIGITDTPTLRDDGSVLSEPGYDESTKYFYNPGLEYPSIPDTPTKEQAQQALMQLCEVWADFTPTHQLALLVPIAALLTVLGRPAIKGNVPCFLFDATTPRSGKGLAMRAVSVIATGDSIATKTWPSRDDGEVDKILCGWARTGQRLVCFDNLKNQFGGPSIEQVLTSTRPTFRLLGLNENPTFDWQTVIFASGNNIRLTNDMFGRTLMYRLAPEYENPELRNNFRHPFLTEWLKAERGRLVAATLTILRAYAVAGYPKTCRRHWGGFEEWHALIGGCIAWLTGIDITDFRPAAVIDDDDTEKESLRIIYELWPQAFPQGATAREAYDKLSNAFAGHAYVDLANAIKALSFDSGRRGEMPDPALISRILRRYRGRIVGTNKLLSVKVNARTVWLVQSIIKKNKYGVPL